VQDIGRKLNGTIHTVVSDMIVTQTGQEWRLALGLLERFSRTDPSPNHNYAFGLREEHTCKWLLRTSEFPSVLEGNDPLLWIHGIPGAGKTVLAAFTADQTRQRCCGKEDYGHAYYYCDFRRDQDETCHFLSWIISQLCRQKRTIPDRLRTLLERGTEVAYHDLLTLLETMVEKFYTVYIVIDGLDESQNRDRLLTLIQKLASSNEFSNMRIIALSREEEDIKRALKGIGSNISMSNSLVDEDISHFIESSVQSDTRMSRWPEDLQLEVKKKLIEGAKGM
jgi:NACHT domain